MVSTLNIQVLSIHSSPMGDLGTRDTGGMSVYVQETASQLRTLGHTVDIFTLGQGNEETAITALGGKNRLIHLAMEHRNTVTKENLLEQMPSLFASYCDFISRENKKYSLIHSHYWLSAHLGMLIREKFRQPHCITFHTLGAVKNRACAEEQETEDRIRSEKILAGNCDRIIAFTEEEKNNLLHLYEVPADKVSIVPCGVNFHQFMAIDRARSKINIDVVGMEKTLLYVGRLVPIKGIDRLLDAIALLGTEFPVKLVIIGDYNGKEHGVYDVREKIRSLQLEKRVVLVGRVKHAELPVYYSAADALVVPSLHESFALVALEALACGTPVIGAPVGVIPQVVRPGMGWLVEKSEPVMLADTIKKLFTVEASLLLHKLQIREAIKQYGWETTADGLQREYIKLSN